MLLALDTSTQFASIVLCENGAVQVEYTWDVGKNHSVELLRCLEWLLRERGLTMARIRAVAASIGPGSFTGVRVAVTVAKTLAFSLSIPLIGICTLDALAFSQAAAALPVWALMDAGRGEWYLGQYRQVSRDQAPKADEVDMPIVGVWAAATIPTRGSAQRHGLFWQRQGDYKIVSVEELARGLTQPTILCADLAAEAKRKLAEALGPHALFAPALLATRRAGALAELAAQRLERGERDDPLTLEPLYLRRPAITVSTKQRPQLAPQDEPPAGAGDDAEQQRKTGQRGEIVDWPRPFQ